MLAFSIAIRHAFGAGICSCAVSAIVYSIAIPENAQSREGAIGLVGFLLSDEGRKIMEEHALLTIQPMVEHTASHAFRSWWIV